MKPYMTRNFQKIKITQSWMMSDSISAKTDSSFFEHFYHWDFKIFSDFVKNLMCGKDNDLFKARRQLFGASLDSYPELPVHFSEKLASWKTYSSNVQLRFSNTARDRPFGKQPAVRVYCYARNRVTVKIRTTDFPWKSNMTVKSMKL